MLYQHMLQTAHLLVVFTFYFLLNLNSVLLDVWDGAFDSSYIASTTYTYCVGYISFCIDPFNPVFICSRNFSRVKEKFKRFDSLRRLTSENLSPGRAVENEYRISETPRNSIGITAVSIPPDPQQQRALLKAHTSYTTNLLMHVKDELAEIGMDDSQIDSFVSEQSYLSTHAKKNEEFSERFLAAQKQWMERYSNVAKN